MNYIPHRKSEIKAMLKTIGVKKIDELFADIPENLKKAKFDLPNGLAELQLLRLSNELARKNTAPEYLSFLGAGAYEHYIPAVVEKIISLPGFLTSYTPYQSEASQGTLEIIFDFQTLVCELTGMEIANASMYDGPTALTEAVNMAQIITGKNKVLVLKTLNPFWRKVLDASKPSKMEIEEIPYDPDKGISNLEELEKKLTEETAAIIVQHPNFFGCLEEVEEIEKIVHKSGALLIACVNPISLGILKRPGDWNADIVVAEGQPLGIPLNFGGPYLGLFATRQKWMRQMPGRLVGKTKDRYGKDAYTLILQAREQHIRRELASSNICTNSNLNAVAFVATLSLLGADGLENITTENYYNAHTLQNLICQIPGFRPKFPSPFFNEFVIESEMPPDELNQRLLEIKIIGGLPLKDYFLELANCLLFCRTETKDGHDVHKLITALIEINNKSFTQDSTPFTNLLKEFPQGKKLNIPRIQESELLKIFTERSEKNFSVDTNFYPLGSCTMKLSPKENETIAGNWRFQNLHPLVPQILCQGTLQILFETQKMLSEICGMKQFTLQPAAGAHGELTGLLITKAYHNKNGETRRNTVLIPDTAHGTNPASASRTEFEVLTIKSTLDGEIDISDLEKKANEKTAALMITLPNTLGLFEKKFLEITEIVHKAGGVVYMDGANMNALLGLVKPGDMGVDILHLNLHKTFSTPHGGGGPGSGPIGVAEKLASFLPTPIVSKNENSYYLGYDIPDSIGKVSGFYGNVGIILKAYFYLRTLGKENLSGVAEFAVLNANYLRTLLQEYYDMPHKRTCMHEFVLQLKPDETMNVAKRLLDYGFHSPTVSFPIHGALMIEPTETEDKETLDEFANAMIKIAKELKENPELVADAPYNTPVKRVNQTTADRNPITKRQ